MFLEELHKLCMHMDSMWVQVTLSRLFSVSAVKGRGFGDMIRPHSLHRSTPNTATARPLCCVWSRKLTGLSNQTAAVFRGHLLPTSHSDDTSTESSEIEQRTSRGSDTISTIFLHLTWHVTVVSSLWSSIFGYESISSLCLLIQDRITEHDKNPAPSSKDIQRLPKMVWELTRMRSC